MSIKTELQNILESVNTYLDPELETQNELIEQLMLVVGLVKSLITFTINGTTYQAEDGMTWWDWCNSEYSMLEFCVDSLDGPIGGYVYGNSLIDIVYNESSSPVVDGELIVSDSNYTLDFNMDGPAGG